MIKQGTIQNETVEQEQGWERIEKEVCKEEEIWEPYTSKIQARKLGKAGILKGREVTKEARMEEKKRTREAEDSPTEGKQKYRSSGREESSEFEEEEENEDEDEKNSKIIGDSVTDEKEKELESEYRSSDKRNSNRA